MALILVINGQERTFEALGKDSTLDGLVAVLGLKGDRVAVERNGEIAARSEWPQTFLDDGDRLEIVQFVGGGVDIDIRRRGHKSTGCHALWTQE